MKGNPYSQAHHATPTAGHYQEPFPLFVTPYTPAWSHYR
jgi:hypothetical protein